MANVNLTQRDIDYISRVVATEVPASLQRTAPDQYKAMVEAVVDTITNRVASTGFPNTVEAVVNQDRQFSKIAGPRNLDPYGSVKNAPKADKGLQKMVETHLTQRANGKPSTVGNSVNYANPNYSTPNNLGWIKDMLSAGGRILGIGDAIHIHGNAPGAKVPDNYTISAPGAIGNPSQMDSKVMGFSPSRNPGTPRMQPGFAQGRTFRNTDGSVFAAPSTRFSGLMTPVRPGVPTPSPRSVMGAAPTSDFRAQPPVITPNKVQTFNFTLANIDPARFAPQASPAELAAQYAQYQRGTPATAPQDITPSRPTANVDPARFAPGPSRAELANQYAQYQRGTVPAAAPAPTVNVDRSRFDNVATPQPNMTANDVRNSYHDQLAGRFNPPTFAPGPTTSQGVRDAQTALAERNRRDQFVRDVLRTGTEVTIAPQPPAVNVDRGRFAPGPSKAELANQYSQYQRGTVPSAQINPTVYDMIDVPQSNTIAGQYASYGAGKIAPQLASTATQAAPSLPNVPQTVGPRSPTVQNPAAINDAAQRRFDAAKPGIYQGIPPSDIYDQNAPGRSGFRGFGAGGFLGNLLTGNANNMAGIEGGNRLPGILGVIQGVVQNLGGPQQAAQAVQSVAPALGQVMGLQPAQQAAKAGNNMVIGRDAAGRIGWVADGGLSGGARGAGWASNNPERFFGGYGGGYDPTPT